MRTYPGSPQGVWTDAAVYDGTPKEPCLPAAPGLWRAAGGGGDRVPGVEGLASPSAPPQPRGQRLHRRRLQSAAPASRQPPAQVPNPDPSPFALGRGDPEGLESPGDLGTRPRSARLSRLHLPAEGPEAWAVEGSPQAWRPAPPVHIVLSISVSQRRKLKL